MNFCGVSPHSDLKLNETLDQDWELSQKYNSLSVSKIETVKVQILAVAVAVLVLALQLYMYWVQFKPTAHYILAGVPCCARCILIHNRDVMRLSSPLQELDVSYAKHAFNVSFEKKLSAYSWGVLALVPSRKLELAPLLPSMFRLWSKLDDLYSSVHSLTWLFYITLRYPSSSCSLAKHAPYNTFSLPIPTVFFYRKLSTVRIS